MSTLLFTQQYREQTGDADEARSTITVVKPDEAVAMQESAPTFNEHKTDDDTGGGLTTRQLASHVIPSERFVPPTLNDDDAPRDGIADVNARQSSNGTAAAREAAGQWGHGTMMVTEGIEPVLGGTTPFGESYAAAPDRPAIVGGNYMQPSNATDAKSKAQAQATAESGARKATQASMYQQWFSSEYGGGI